MDHLHQQLKQLGLHKSEIVIYLYLLEQGISSPPQIAKGTHIAITNCYNIVRCLKDKGLINEQKIGKRKAYLANDPEAIIYMLDLKKRAAEQIVPNLRGLFKMQKNKPRIRFYSGIEQVKEIYLSTLLAKKVYGFGSTKLLSELAPELYKYYLAQLKQNNVVFYDILSYPSQNKGAPEMKEALKGLYDMKFLPQEYGDQPTDILFWDDNIAFITLEEPIFGTIIISPLIAKTFGIIFDLIWKNLS